MTLDFQDPISSQSVVLKEISDGIFSIGRSPSCDVIIPAQYSSVSSLHATIKSKGGATEIIDGNAIKPSTNGVFIDGQKIGSGEWHSLMPGMSVSLGKHGQPTSISLIIRVQSFMPTSSSARSIAVPIAPQQQATTESKKTERFLLDSSEDFSKSLLATWYKGASGLNNQTGQMIMTSQRLVFCARNRLVTAAVTGPLLDMILRSDKIRWQISVGNIESISSFKRLGIKTNYRVMSKRHSGEEFVFTFNPGAGSNFERWADKFGFTVTKEGGL